MPIRRYGFINFILSLAALGLLVWLPLNFPPDGQTRADLLRFVGRFHSLAVHFPIALLCIVPVLELIARNPKRAMVGEGAGLVMWLAAITTSIATALGWMLAYADGNAGAEVTNHMWAGVATAIGTFACALVRIEWPIVYRILLTGTVASMFLAGHLGGQLTHGDDFLSKYLPPAVARWTGTASPANGAGANATVYSEAIAPMLDEHCNACHCEKKAKAKLRMDTYELLMKGGKSGPIIVPHHPEKSEAVHRVTLPSEDDDFMPSDNKPPLSAAQVELLKWWILTGASDKQRLSAARTAPLAVKALLAAPPKK